MCASVSSLFRLLDACVFHMPRVCLRSRLLHACVSTEGEASAQWLQHIQEHPPLFTHLSFILQSSTNSKSPDATVMQSVITVLDITDIIYIFFASIAIVYMW